MSTSADASPDPVALRASIAQWAMELGFAAIGVSGITLDADAAHLEAWLAQGRHGSMDYMARHAALRADPAALHAGTLRVISVRMDYWPASAAEPWALLGDDRRGYIARYALGRDYHGLMRRRLQRLADRIAAAIGPFGYRAFVDSAPVLEKALARDAGLGWIGKHTLLLARDAGSYFFLGELFTDLPLPADAAPTAHCGSCARCIEICPTRAITGPRQLDARRCIAYLTIEHRGSIPEPLRPLLGNRIFGCDDCQLVCPWNRYARASTLPDFAPRHGLDAPLLVELFAWDEATWHARTEGMALRRVGYAGWLRNIAVALGNAAPDAQIVAALSSRAQHADALVREHVAWALARQRADRA